MSVVDTREQLGDIARAEFAAWKRDPMPRRPPAARKGNALLIAPTGPCGEGPADPQALRDLVNDLSPVRAVTPAEAWPPGSSRAVVECLIARGLDEHHVARVAKVDVDRVRNVRARMDERAAS